MGPLRQAELGERWSEAVTGALRPGMRLGRYELLVPIGSGGMACVWAARLTGYRGFSKLLALKTLLPHLAHQPDFENMLLDEARIAAHANHPNVCNVFDVGEEHGIGYLVLEWVEGDSLLHVLRGVPAGEARALDCRVASRIVADVCAGLHAAHRLVDDSGEPLCVVHRDVSPHNVLVSVDGTTKIADFGVAKAQNQLHQATRAGEIRGKVAYMAPEQISGAIVCPRSDVFAAGCVLYHATTGRPPFRGDGDARVIRAVMDGSYDAPTDVAPDYPRELAAVVGRALAPRPEDRFESAAQMGLALESWLAAGRQRVTSADVGRAVQERIGDKLERRREQVRAALEMHREGGTTRPVRSERLRVAVGVDLQPAPTNPARANVVSVKLLPPAGDAAKTPSSARPPPPAALQGAKTAIAIALGIVLAAGLLAIRSQWVPPRAASSRDLDTPVVRTPLAAVDSRALPAVAAARSADGEPAGSVFGARVAVGLASSSPSTSSPSLAPAVVEPAAGRMAPSPAHAANASSTSKGAEIPANPY